MGIITRIKNRLVSELLPPLPFESHQHISTRVFSQYDDPYQPSNYLVHLAADMMCDIENVKLEKLASRPQIESFMMLQWPGEHHKMLAALVRVLKPKRIIEIGTLNGWSALAMKEYLPADGRIDAFDIMDWQQFAKTAFQPADFADGRLVYHVEDLADPAVAARNHDLLAAADLVFLDGPHDGDTEYRMIENFRKVHFTNNPLFVFDDIKMHDMMKLWRELPLPKMDITSLGHYSGTGIAEWKWPDNIPPLSKSAPYKPMMRALK